MIPNELKKFHKINQDYTPHHLTIDKLIVL